MLRAINHDFSVSRICGFQHRRLDSNQQPPSNGLLPPSYNGANVAADYSPVTLLCWFADYIYASLRWDAGERLTATREGSSTACKPHPWGRPASQVCPKCRRLASNQRPPRLQLGALANWATTAALSVIVIIWWHVDNNPCCHNWLSRPWRESNPPRLLRQRSILPQDITAMNELIMSSLTAIKSDSIRSYIIWNTCIRLQSVAFNHMMVFNARSTRPFWFMYLTPQNKQRFWDSRLESHHHHPQPGDCRRARKVTWTLILLHVMELRRQLRHTSDF